MKLLEESQRKSETSLLDTS